MKTKICSECHKRKKVIEFHKDKRSKNNYKNNCKICTKNRYNKNKKNIRKKQKEYYERNKLKILKKQKRNLIIIIEIQQLWKEL